MALVATTQAYFGELIKKDKQIQCEIIVGKISPLVIPRLEEWHMLVLRRRSPT